MTETAEIDFLGLGYTGLDTFSVVPYIPLDDKVEIKQILIQPGGPAATATYAAAKLGCRTAFLGAIGRDDQGKAILDAMAACGTSAAGMAVRETGQTPTAYCWVDEASGKRSIAWTRGSIRPLDPSELDEKLIRRARLLHLDGHQTAAALAAVEIAQAAGVTVALDAGTLVPGIETLVARSHIVIASEKFAERFTGGSDPEVSVKTLFGQGRKFSAVTLGSRGSIGFDGKTVYRQPAFAVNVVDTTGAGDVFHGAFGAAVLRGMDWAGCLRFAAAVAALKCTKLGGRTGVPTLAEAETFLRNHK